MNNNNNLEYDNELNNRLLPRNRPSVALQPLYNVRPTATKYTWFHSIDRKLNVPTLSYDFNIYNDFNPGDRAPINYFIQNIDKESQLRNQFMALQKSDQAAYVPELNSDLYKNKFSYEPIPFSVTNSVNERKCQPESSVFYNHIRTNVRK